MRRRRALRIFAPSLSEDRSASSRKPSSSPRLAQRSLLRHRCHSASCHPSCWKPLDVYQERPPQYQHFNLYGHDVPSHGELIAHRDRCLARHPNTTFIACHLGNIATRLGRALEFDAEKEQIVNDDEANRLLDGAEIPYFAKGEQLQNLFGVGQVGTGFNPIVGPVELLVSRSDCGAGRRDK